MSGDLIDAVRSAASEIIDDVVEKLRAGVRIPSVTPAERTFQEFFAGELEQLGCRVEVWEPEGLPGRPNVIGWLPADERPDGGRAHLILNSHADTVAPGDDAAWRHPPFAGALEGGAVFGLGSADAKGCLFTFLGAAMALRRAEIRLKRSVMIQSVVDEEWGGAGVLACVRRGHTATAAVVGEPTGLRVCPASRGAMGLHLRVFGGRAHPGEGWRGVNAIRKAWQYIEALDRLRDELDRTHMHPLWAALPSGHVWNLMGIAGGAMGMPAARSVPDACEVNYGIGLIGAESPDAMRPIIEEALNTVTAADPWLSAHPPEITWRPGAFEPAVTDPAHPAVGELARAVTDLAYGPSVVQALSAATDARHLVGAGGIPSINFGPGELRLAHSPLEYLPVDELRKAIEIMALFIARYCGFTRRES